MKTVYVVDQFVRVGFDTCRQRMGIFSTEEAAIAWLAEQASVDYDVTPVTIDALGIVISPTVRLVDTI